MNNTDTITAIIDLITAGVDVYTTPNGDVVNLPSLGDIERDIEANGLTVTADEIRTSVEIWADERIG